MQISRYVLAGALLVASHAHAQPKRKVAIDSSPPGAEVYLNSKEDGSLCKTPCSVDVPVGETPVIIELAGHVPLIEQLVVPKRGKVPGARFALTPALGTIIVDGPRGAMVSIDGEERGKAPVKLEVAAGPHMVDLALGGETIDSQAVDVEADAEVTVSGSARAPAPARTAAGGDDEEIVVDDTDTAVTAATPAPPRRDPIVALAAMVDVGFRTFTYEGVMTPETLRKENEAGQVLAGPQVEVWPGTLAGVRMLRGLSLVGRISFPLNKQQVTGPGLVGTTTTFWQMFEVALRHRWVLADRASIQVSAGYGRDQHQFNTNAPGDLALVPDVEYQSVRIGARASVLLGSIEPYLAGENRIVLSGGVLEDRFSRGGEASGLHGALGVVATFGAFALRIEGSLTSYSWSFEYNTDDMFRATGATDSIKLVSTSLSYRY